MCVYVCFFGVIGYLDMYEILNIKCIYCRTKERLTKGKEEKKNEDKNNHVDVAKSCLQLSFTVEAKY